MNTYKFKNSVPFKLQPLDVNNNILTFGSYGNGDAINGTSSGIKVTATVYDLVTNEIAVSANDVPIENIPMYLNATNADNKFAQLTIEEGFAPESSQMYSVTMWYESTDGRISYSEQFSVRVDPNTDIVPPTED